MTLKCSRCDLRGSIFQNFPWGACPQTPLACSMLCMLPGVAEQILVLTGHFWFCSDICVGQNFETISSTGTLSIEQLFDIHFLIATLDFTAYFYFAWGCTFIQPGWFCVNYIPIQSNIFSVSFRWSSWLEDGNWAVHMYVMHEVYSNPVVVLLWVSTILSEAGLALPTCWWLVR